MNKKLLAAAIAAGLMVPGLAAADVKISGVIQAEAGNVDFNNNGGVAGADFDTTLAGNNAGGTSSGALLGGGNNQVTFSGDEKMGNGLSAFFKLGYQFDTFDTAAGGGSGWQKRDSIVGLKGDGWSVGFGRMSNAYKVSNMDPLNTTGLQARAIGLISDQHNGYADNWAEGMFKSGNVTGKFGFTWEDSTNNAKVATAAGAGSGGRGAVNDQVDSGSWAGSIEYKDKTWLAGFAASNNDYGTGAGSTDAWKIYGKYSANDFTVFAHYEDLDADRSVVAGGRADGTGDGFDGNVSAFAGGVAIGGAHYDAWMLGATYKISGNTTLIGRYNNVELDETIANGNDDVDVDAWTIAVIHGLSKRTEIYGGYETADYDTKRRSDADVDVWMIGMRHKF
jgi:predicted porin